MKTDMKKMKMKKRKKKKQKKKKFPKKNAKQKKKQKQRKSFWFSFSEKKFNFHGRLAEKKGKVKGELFALRPPFSVESGRGCSLISFQRCWTMMYLNQKVAAVRVEETATAKEETAALEIVVAVGAGLAVVARTAVDGAHSKDFSERAAQKAVEMRTPQKVAERLRIQQKVGKKAAVVAE